MAEETSSLHIDFDRLQEAFKKIKCPLTLDEIFASLQFGRSDLIDWREAKWRRQREMDQTMSGLLLLTTRDLFFIPKMPWPMKLDKKALEGNHAAMPISSIEEVKLDKGFFDRQFNMLKITGLIEKKRFALRAKKKHKETFHLSDPESFAQKIIPLNPAIKYTY